MPYTYTPEDHRRARLFFGVPERNKTTSLDISPAQSTPNSIPELTSEPKELEIKQPRGNSYSHADHSKLLAHIKTDHSAALAWDKFGAITRQRFQAEEEVDDSKLCCLPF